MRFGDTTQEAARKRQLVVMRKILGVKKFALFPTRLTDGTYVWLESYWRYYRGILHQNNSLHVFYFDGYCIRNHPDQSNNHVWLDTWVAEGPKGSYVEQTPMEAWKKLKELI